MFSRLLVQSVGCKEIRLWNTIKCIGRIEFRNDDSETTSATTVEDIFNKAMKRRGQNIPWQKSTTQSITVSRSRRGSAVMFKKAKTVVARKKQHEKTIERLFHKQIDNV